MWNSQGNPTYGANGAAFAISQQGNAPSLISKFYIMFGRVSIVSQAAPGTGVVSSCVLQSDDLDEIDWEWLGTQGNQVQTNYFGRGQTGSYNRGAQSNVNGNQQGFHTYTIDWNANQIVWSIDGQAVRSLQAGQANNQYPQTPMQIRLGAWAGGDSSNAPGTIRKSSSASCCGEDC